MTSIGRGHTQTLLSHGSEHAASVFGCRIDVRLYCPFGGCSPPDRQAMMSIISRPYVRTISKVFATPPGLPGHGSKHAAGAFGCRIYVRLYCLADNLVSNAVDRSSHGAQAPLTDSQSAVATYILPVSCSGVGDHRLFFSPLGSSAA